MDKLESTTPRHPVRVEVRVLSRHIIYEHGDPMKNMNRREFMSAALAAAALRQTPPLPARPNVLFILADDLGYGDLSCYGRPDYKTPVIDGLANEGMKFSDNYANGDVCTPTRVAFQTGRYQHRLLIGLQQPLGDANTEIGLPADHPTIASLLK